MKRSFLLLMLGLVLTGRVTAQHGEARLQGQVLDQEGAPLPFATVLLYTLADSSLVKAGYTDEEGRFELFPLHEGDYRLRLTFSGLAPHESDPLKIAAGETRSYPAVWLREPETELEGVQITAEKPVITVMPDKTVFNVEGSPNAIGSNALDLLRKAPGVVIDNNDNIRLMGKSGVRIYIDGKPSPLSATDLAAVLKSMQSAEIEAIEVITNPGAKYDAEGNAGIINIRLKKDKSLGANATVNLGYGIGVYSKYNGGVTANYRSKRVNAYGVYLLNRGRHWDYVNFDRSQVNSADHSVTRIRQEAETITDFAFHSFRGGADFFINGKHTLGLQASGYAGHNDRHSGSFARISDSLTNVTQSYLLARSANERDLSNLNFNLSYRIDDHKGLTWNLDLDYGRFDFHNASWQPNTYLDTTRTFVLDQRDFRTIAPNDVLIRTLKADHERPLLGGSLGAGMKFSLVTTDNVFDFYQVIDGVDVLDSARSNRFVYRENVNAAYLSFNRRFGKLSIQAGLRAEQTNSLGDLSSVTAADLEAVERHYVNLFPSGGISWEAHEKHSFALNYSRRIDRPRYQQLNPFEIKLDELTYRRGNPFLQPQMTGSYGLTHTFAQRLTTTLSYSRTLDYISDFIDTTEVPRAYQTLVNLGLQEVWSVNVALPFSMTKWWSTYTTGGAHYTHNTADLGEGRSLDLGRGSWNVYHQSTFQLPKDISVQVSGFYNAPSLWAANFFIGDFWGVDLGLSWRFADGRGTLQLSATDIFWGQRWGGVQDFAGLHFAADGGDESRQVKANLSWRFGNRQVRDGKRSTGLEDEKKRVGAGN